MDFRSFVKKTDRYKLIGLGTGIGSYRKKSNYSERLFKNYIDICKNFDVKFIDTSPVYGNGKSEKYIGKFLKSSRKNFFIATKIMPEMCWKNKVRVSVINSLKRLKTNYIDLLQIHWPNEMIPFEETINEMINLKKEGLIKNIGLCNFSYEQLRGIYNKFGPNTISSIQIEYNLFERSAEKKLIPFCMNKNILIIAYSPLAQGKIANGIKQLKLIDQLAKKYNCTSSQIVLSWISSKKKVIAIPNSSSEKNLINNFQSKKLKIIKEDLRRIDKVCMTKVKYINTRKIKVSNNYGRKVYKNLTEALKNKMKLTPSPLELSKEIKKGNFLKPVRLKKIKRNNRLSYDLIEGRLRYWSWVIAFGWRKGIPALVWED